MPAYTTPEATERPAGEAEAPPLAPETQDRTSEYMARLEAHLADLPTGNRVRFLADLKLWWIAEYDRWTFRVDGDMATATDLKSNAADFVCTIAAVSARHAREVSRG